MIEKNKIMKITDLQIGDYVWAQNNPVKTQKIIGLTANSYTGHQTIYIQGLATGVVSELSIEDISGIKLTKAILKMNGWINDLYTILLVDNNRYLKYYWHENRLQYIWNGVDEWENRSEVKDIIFQCENIKCVHELQHALKLCGLDNLANNFKV